MVHTIDGVGEGLTESNHFVPHRWVGRITPYAGEQAAQSWISLCFFQDAIEVGQAGLANEIFKRTRSKKRHGFWLNRLGQSGKREYELPEILPAIIERHVEHRVERPIELGAFASESGEIGHGYFVR